MTGSLRRYDEVRAVKPFAAECEVRLELRREDDGALVWAGTLSARENLKENTPSALAEALGKAVAKVITQAVAQITALGPEL